jgi:type II secretory pathway pseudopilin PulG
MIKRYTSKRGLGLLELMLVMVVAASILVLVMAQNRQFQQQSNIRITQQRAELIMDKMNIAYRALCAEQAAESFLETDTQDILSTMVSDDELTNPLDKDVTFQYQYITRGSYTLQNSSTDISIVHSVVTLALPAQYGYYYGQFGAQCVVLEEPCTSSGSNCNPCGSALDISSLETSADPVYLVWTQLPSRIKLSSASNAISLYNANLFTKQYVTYFEQNMGESDNQGEQILQEGFYLCQG